LKARTTGEQEYDTFITCRIDDEKTARELIASRLQELGCETVECGRPEEALQLARELHPAAITLDVMMSGMDGWSVLSTLKQDPLTRDIPVVMVTVTNTKEIALLFGACDYISKPAAKSDLMACLDKIMIPLEGTSVLCVDDDPAIRDLLRRTLDGLGVSVRAVAGAGEALAEVDRQAPDLIFVDLMMPDMSGFELISHLRSRPSLERVPIVVLTAQDPSSAELATLRGKIERFIAKTDFRPGDLPATVRQVVQQSARSC